MKAYKRFLSYSYEPFRLHFCGPQDDASTKLVDDFLKGFDISAARLNRVARDFAGVYPYLELIAKKNKLEPLDEQVIEAYWIGNNLLRQVTVEDLKNLILQSFIGPGKLSLSAGERLAAGVPGRAVAHHSFHVLYVGSVTQTVRLAGKLLDLCRVGWGRVIAYGGEVIQVKYRPLIVKPNDLRLGRDEAVKEIKWNKKVLPKVMENQIVTFHWGLACETVSEDQARNLEKYTLRNIDAVNHQ
ncbi:MAG TPA: hypothetical protein DEB69_02370 [Candidatus Komeilibacteria bacterium]|nr:MAG: hypothetical protein UW91_C0026G0030 [Parcubacteria group bacterium GW2011_GWF2_45_11]HBV02247.1 hypothetical protein [Candidatus Komeilibacteria bacterium]